MRKPYIYESVVKEWANGAKIESRMPRCEWSDDEFPHWYGGMEYRVKKYRPKDIVLYVAAYSSFGFIGKSEDMCEYDNLKLTFDGETGKLKSALVLT